MCNVHLVPNRVCVCVRVYMSWDIRNMRGEKNQTKGGGGERVWSGGESVERVAKARSMLRETRRRKSPRILLNHHTTLPACITSQSTPFYQHMLLNNTGSRPQSCRVSGSKLSPRTARGARR